MRLFRICLRRRKHFRVSKLKMKCKMESKKRRQRKRKSPCNKDIFEVNEKDLSPEHAELSDEPEAKILKTRNSDISDSRQNNEKHNLESEKNFLTENDVQDFLIEKDTKNLIVSPENTQNEATSLCDERERMIERTPQNTPDKEDLTLSVPDALEDGEVSDSILEPAIPNSETSVTITFFDKSVADIYKGKFLKFIQSFVEFEITSQDDTTINICRDVNLDPRDWVVLDDTLCMSDIKKFPRELLEPEEELAKELPATPKNKVPKKKKKKEKQKELFVVDTLPNLDAHKNVGHTKYSTKFLINEKEEEQKIDINKPTFSSVCFNCDMEHSLKDCPNPKNFAKITASRQKFISKNKTSRYHLEDEQKYTHLKPGIISTNLKNALGLKKNQIPTYIYQMRICGYPPGWLEEAKFVQSDLELFDIDGNNVKNKHTKIKGLDSEKVVNYPGFNVPLEKEYKDEYKYYRVPPYSEDFCKNKMIEYFKKQCLTDEDNFEKQDMDLDFTNDIISNATKENKTDIKIKNKNFNVVVDSQANVSSPSLNDLEKEKETLLEQLNKPDDHGSSEDTSEELAKNSRQEIDIETGSSTDEPPTELQEDKNIDVKDTPKKIEVALIESTEINISCYSPAPQNENVNNVRMSTFGTPILKSNSPYNHLPNPDNFSKDVSPVINFENLPDSTGKYEQMTGVLQKVRDTLKNLHQFKT